MTTLTQSIEAVTEYLRQFDRLRDTGGKIHGVATDPANPDGVDLLAADLHRVLTAARREQEREPKPGLTYVEGRMVIDGVASDFLIQSHATTNGITSSHWYAEQRVLSERTEYVAAVRAALFDAEFFTATNQNPEAAQ